MKHVKIEVFTHARGTISWRLQSPKMHLLQWRLLLQAIIVRQRRHSGVGAS